MTIVINLEGGLVQEVYTPAPVTIVIRDYDIEGVGEEELTTDEGGRECYETARPSDPWPDGLTL